MINGAGHQRYSCAISGLTINYSDEMMSLEAHTKLRCLQPMRTDTCYIPALSLIRIIFLGICGYTYGYCDFFIRWTGNINPGELQCYSEIP
jgi:hypothetical protein